MPKVNRRAGVGTASSARHFCSPAGAVALAQASIRSEHQAKAHWVQVMWNWRRWIVAWDGLLPLAISVLPFQVKTFLPRNDIAEVSTVVVVTAAAALLRTAIGSYQVRTHCGGRLPANRQLALAAAIILLMLYEGMVAILTFANDEPWSAWIYPAVFYACYLATIGFAFSAAGNYTETQ